jgi:hypothetical protein
VVGLVVVGLVVAAIATGIAVKQNRSASFTSEQQTFAPPEAPAGDAPGFLRLQLDIHTAGVSVRPLPPGEPLRVEADYDPRAYAFDRSRAQVEGVELLTVELRPTGSKMIALLRSKLGGRPPMLRIGLPPGVGLEIVGRLERTFAAMELGGLPVQAIDLDVEEGGVKVSFGEPLTAPMEEMRIIVNRGALSIAGLGNASPRETVFLQHLGAVDLDLRGAWVRDADLRLISAAAGGSVWLPDNVRVVGIDDNRGLRLLDEPELERPTLNVSLEEKVGRVVVMD